MTFDTIHQILISHTGKSTTLCAFRGFVTLFYSLYVYHYELGQPGGPAVDRVVSLLDPG